MQKSSAERERRIHHDIVADAHDSEERAAGWFSYLDDQLQCPFLARCVARRAISPLRVGDEVEVLGLAPQEECEREIFVMMRWEENGLGVPLSQLKPVQAEPDTIRAVADWHYWTAKGYRF